MWNRISRTKLLMSGFSKRVIIFYHRNEIPHTTHAIVDLRNQSNELLDYLMFSSNNLFTFLMIRNKMLVYCMPILKKP